METTKRPGPIGQNQILKTILTAAGLAAAVAALAINGYLLPVALGLLGLNLVVLIHEAGHYITARKSGVEVLVFSIGMGPRLFGVRRNGIDYRISLLPVGGYVRMKGESLFEEALQKNDRSILEEEGSLFAVDSFKRIVIAAAGAIFNLISAVGFFFLAYLVGFSTPTDRVLAPITHFAPEARSAAAESGLMAGDLILTANGEKVAGYTDLVSLIKGSGGLLPVTVLRDEQEVSFEMELDKTPQGMKAGLVSVVSPEVSKIEPGSAFELIGIQKGDRIHSINGREIDYFSWYHLSAELDKGAVTIDWLSGDQLNRGILEPDSDNNYGIMQMKLFRTYEGKQGLLHALKMGITKPGAWIVDNFTGLYKVAKDPDKSLKENTAGPIGITTGIGMMTIDGFKTGFFDGFGNFFMLVGLISSIIAVMNLLPIPALDGGLILFTLIEAIRGKRFSPKAFFRYQLFGFFVIMILAFLIISVDISNLGKLF